MNYFWSFVVCGLLCLIAQIILDNTKLTPGHVTSLFVVAGAVLGALGIYPWIVEHVGGGAMVPITSFGNQLFLGSYETAMNGGGLLGLITGVFKLTTGGISSAILFTFLFSVLFRPKKN